MEISPQLVGKVFMGLTYLSVPVLGYFFIVREESSIVNPNNYTFLNGRTKTSKEE